MSSAITAVAVGSYLSNRSARQQQEAADEAQARALGFQDAASRRSLEQQQAQYDQTREDTRVQREVGDEALNYLSGALQPGGEYSPQPFEMGDFTADPGYQFRFDQGEQAGQNALSAGGMKLSGRAAKELTRYGQGFASNEYGNVYNRKFGEFNQNEANKQNYLSRQMQLAGYGSQGINTAAGAGANQANQNQANYINTGANQANIANQYGADTANISGQNYQNQNTAIQGGIQNYLALQQAQRQRSLFNQQQAPIRQPSTTSSNNSYWLSQTN